jgi:hypothetical protein
VPATKSNEPGGRSNPVEGFPLIDNGVNDFSVCHCATGGSFVPAVSSNCKRSQTALASEDARQWHTSRNSPQSNRSRRCLIGDDEHQIERYPFSSFL